MPKACNLVFAEIDELKKKKKKKKKKKRLTRARWLCARGGGCWYHARKRFWEAAVCKSQVGRRGVGPARPHLRATCVNLTLFNYLKGLTLMSPTTLLIRCALVLLWLAASACGSDADGGTNVALSPRTADSAVTGSTSVDGGVDTSPGSLKTGLDGGVGALADGGAAALADAATRRVPRSASTNDSEIETVTIHGQTVSSGFLTLTEPYPVVLLTDGWACLEMDFVAQPGNAETHRAANPQSWVRWVRTNGRVILGGKYAAFGGSVPPKPAGFRLDGLYTYTKSSGGGDLTSISERSFRFTSAGLFGYGSSSSFSTGNAIGGNFPPDQRGTYEIDGYLINLRFDDGDTVVVSFVDDGDLIYVAGRWYGP